MNLSYITSKRNRLAERRRKRFLFSFCCCRVNGLAIYHGTLDLPQIQITLWSRTHSSSIQIPFIRIPITRNVCVEIAKCLSIFEAGI
jgi:hypothetical protein